MLSLSQLLSAHAPLLLIDSASASIQVGLFTAEGKSRWRSSTEEAGVGLFRCVEALAVPLSDVRGFVFCEGPGSVLGIRTAAMAVRTWTALKPRPIFGYSGLRLVAEASGRGDVTVVADARREMWHAFRIGQPLRRVPTAELSGELTTPEGFRQWSKPPAQLTTTPYNVESLLSKIPEAPVFIATTSPDAFLHEEPSYLTWTPHIHRARSTP